MNGKTALILYLWGLSLIGAFSYGHVFGGMSEKQKAKRSLASGNKKLYDCNVIVTNGGINESD